MPNPRWDPSKVSFSAASDSAPKIAKTPNEQSFKMGGSKKTKAQKSGKKFSGKKSKMQKSHKTGKK